MRRKKKGFTSYKNLCIGFITSKCITFSRSQHFKGSTLAQFRPSDVSSCAFYKAKRSLSPFLCFQHLLLQYISCFRKDHIVGHYKAVEKLLTSNTPRRETQKATDSQLQAVCAGEERHKRRDQKTPPGIHIYLSSSAFYPHSTELYFLALLRGKAVLVHLRAGGCWAARVIAVGADSDNLLFPLIFLVPLARINAVWQSKCASAAVN